MPNLSPPSPLRTSHAQLVAVVVLVTIGIAAAFASPTSPAQTEPMPRDVSPLSHPTLADLWDGRARFAVDVAATGLPMGESDTVLLPDGSLRAYIHASARSAGVVDQCGDPVDFPGCLVVYTSEDGGRSFAPLAGTDQQLTCQIPCRSCPCASQIDHVDQQQYPRVALWSPDPPEAAQAWTLVYEYRANTILRRSPDGLNWSVGEELPLSGIWRNWLMSCRPEETIGLHPHAPAQYDCLTGSPPGIYVETTRDGPELYVFVGLGQNPSAMGCYRGPLGGPAALLRKCNHTPLFTGSPTYGPPDRGGPAANRHFDFRTISSAEVVRLGAGVYMLYEGVRGPDAGDPGDTQFALGLARSTTGAVDAPWERFPGNPVLVDLPGNVGLGHADLVTVKGITYLYTSLDGLHRSRLQLVWSAGSEPSR